MAVGYYLRTFRQVLSDSKSLRICLLSSEEYVADIFKTKIFVYQSKVNSDMKILFGKINHR